MSYYEDERQQRRSTRDRPRRDDYDESVYSRRGENNRTTTLVKRRDSYDDVDEEITREFSPPDGRGGYIRETTIRKSGVRPARARSYDEDRYRDDRYDDYGYGGARRGDSYRDDRRDRDRRRRYSSDHSSRSRSRTPPPRDRRKSKVEETLESLGLGGLVGGILGKEAKDRSSSRNRARSRSRSGRDRAYSETRSDRRSSPGRSKEHTREQITQAIKAAVLAGAGEAFRSRKEPGGFNGEKGKRILTAAFSAGGVDGLINSNKDPESHKLRDTVGSAIAGMATSRIVNGPRSKSRGRGSRSPDSYRGRSQSRGGVGDLLAGGTIAATAKKIYDNMRSPSQTRGRSDSRYSDDSRSPSRSKSRRRSVSRAAARGLAAVGLSSAADKVDPERRRSTRRYSDEYNDRGSYYSDYRDDVGQPRSGDINGRARSESQSRSDWHVSQRDGNKSGSYSLDFGARHNGDPDTDSDSDLGSSSGEEKERKKGKRKMWLTTGLASIATIHAGHSVYQSYEKHQGRVKAVREGKISSEQAKKNQNRDRFQEAASLGIAALGIKGAYSEWKEMREHKEEFDQEKQKHERHHNKREARRKKYELLEKQGYLDNGYANSMPNLSQLPPTNPPPGGWHHPFDQPPQYNSQGPYSAGGFHTDSPRYYDDNPYSGSFVHSTDQFGGSPYPPPPVGNNNYPRAPRQRSPSRGRTER